MKIYNFWKEFLSFSKLNKDTKYLEAFHFELTESLANKLLDLVVIGQKKATSSSLLAYEIKGEKLPSVGDFSIVTDWDGNPRCVIQTREIRIIPFKDITFDICKLEGEDDSLESWQLGHIKFFKAEGRRLGYVFSEDMPVVFEKFEVVYQI